MADRWAVATGNWSSTATWDGGTLPGSGDDVFADGRTVTIDQDITVLSIRTTQRSGGTAGGGFILSGTRVVNADSYAGSGNCLTLNAGSVQNGDSYGSQTTNTRYGTILSAGSIQNGNAFGGNGTARAGTNISGGGVFYGNATGGSSSGGHGIIVGAGGVAIVDVAEGSTSGAFGVQSTSASRHVVLIKTESGSFAKSLGTGAEVTDANVPFVNYNASGGGSASGGGYFRSQFGGGFAQ